LRCQSLSLKGLKSGAEPVDRFVPRKEITHLVARMATRMDELQVVEDFDTG
jgi:hypothetical protein